MALGDKIQVADKPTLDATKTQADAIKSDTATILSEMRGQRPKRYGFRIKNSEGSPTGRVEYLYDAVGMTRAGMNFTTGAFSYGSWKDLWFIRDNHPCMVKSDGTLGYWLDDNDYTKKAADGSASDVANSSYGGNAMSAIPLVWVKRWTEGGYRYVSFCESQYDESYHAYAHTGADGAIRPYRFWPMFRGSKVDTKLRSLKGLAPTSSTTAEAERTAAKANGTSWDICDWALWNLLMDLLYLIGGSTNVQATFGQGHSTGGSSAADFLTTGTLSDKGQFFGYNDTTHAVKVFHSEVIYAERWERLVGMILDNGVYKVKMTPEGNGYNLTGAGYEPVAECVPKPAGTEGTAYGGWVKEAQQTPYGQFPTVLGGSEVTYDCDYHYINCAIVSVPLVGAACSDGGECGRYVNVNNAAGNAYWRIGASPSC